MSEQVATALIAAGAALAGLWIGHSLGQEHDRRNRLRELYADVMLAALRLIPRSFGYRLGADADEATTSNQVDALVARLRVEPRSADGERVHIALLRVQGSSVLYALDKEDERAPADQSRKSRAAVEANLRELEAAIHESLDDRGLLVRWSSKISALLAKPLRRGQ